ncbi:hypothetical protein ES708_23042 [subsurface metagenome]
MVQLSDIQVDGKIVRPQPHFLTIYLGMQVLVGNSGGTRGSRFAVWVNLIGGTWGPTLGGRGTVDPDTPRFKWVLPAETGQRGIGSFDPPPDIFVEWSTTPCSLIAFREHWGRHPLTLSADILLTFQYFSYIA